MKDILPELNGKDYIEKLNENYDIRFCRIDEFDEMIEFIDTYWRKNHIFVLSKEMFDFQHLNLEDDRYDFLIAKHKESGEIHSILGFVTSNHFDRDIKGVEVWPAIWKTRDDIKVKGLGVGLFYYLKEHMHIDNISPIGLSPISLGIYKHWNFETGKTRHYVFPNQNLSESYLCDNLDMIEKRTLDEDTLKLEKIDLEDYEKIDENEEVFADLNKYKSKKYYINRFYKHPLYKYDFYAIKDEHVRAIMIARQCGHLGHNCLRIVDFIGDIAYLKNVGNQLVALMDKNGYEYIDFVEVGLDDAVLNAAHFVDKDNYEGLVVPNYFEPFEKRNIYLDYALRSIDGDKAIFFKADSDQDRPNLLNPE